MSNEEKKELSFDSSGSDALDVTPDTGKIETTPGGSEPLEIKDEPKNEQAPVEVPEEPKIELPKTYHCKSCKSDLPIESLIKKPLDFKKNEDGSVSAEPHRFTVLCGKCEGFIGITDPDAAKALRELRKKPEQPQ